jgi:alanyl-tRNA synthetase
VQLGNLKVTDDPSLNVIADHIRSCAFLIADGVIPSNEGRGYVLRRIIRRAVRHGRRLQMPDSFFHCLVPVLVSVMGDAYPELAQQQTHIEEVLLHEETQFAHTLEQGLRLLQEHIHSVQDRIISGDVAFKLYDTYGFPVDLTADIAREHEMQVDLDGFKACMQRQRAQSQATSQFQAEYVAVSTIAMQSIFHGYTGAVVEGRVLALIQGDVVVEQLPTGAAGIVILSDTTFYAESGGQVGDQGVLRAAGIVFRVDNTTRQGQAILHHGVVMEGTLTAHAFLSAEIDVPRREAIRLNHTATHLLHAALRVVF